MATDREDCMYVAVRCTFTIIFKIPELQILRGAAAEGFACVQGCR